MELVNEVQGEAEMRGERLQALDVKLLTRWNEEQPHASSLAALSEDHSLTRQGWWLGFQGSLVMD